MSADHEFRDERLVAALVVAVLVTVLVGLQASLFGGSRSVASALPLLQGVAVGLYGAVLAICIERWRGFGPALLFLALGVSQPLWVLGMLMLLSALGVQRSMMPDSLWLSLPFVQTGIVFGLVSWWAARQVWALLAVCAAAALSSWLVGWGPLAIGGLDADAIAISVLHLGICWTLAIAAIQRTWRIVPKRQLVCSNSGYPRDGLRADVCPECGETW